MIIDIENKGTYLRVSHFGPEGDLSFLEVPVPEDQRFNWEKCSPHDPKRDKEWTNWMGEPVKKIKTDRYDKYRMAQLLIEAPDELTKPLWEFQNPSSDDLLAFLGQASERRP